MYLVFFTQHNDLRFIYFHVLLFIAEKYTIVFLYHNLVFH